MPKKKKSPVDGLTDTQIMQLKDTFDIFDRKGEGIIETRDAGAIFEALGLELSEAEIEAAVQEVDVDGSGQLDFPEFLMLMCEQMGDQDKVMEEVIKCFKHFDEDGMGKIKAKQISHVMCMMGDRMPKMDVEEMMALVGIEDGYVDFEAMIDEVAAGSKNETPEEKFDSMDKDGNGLVSKGEFIAASKGR